MYVYADNILLAEKIAVSAKTNSFLLVDSRLAALTFVNTQPYFGGGSDSEMHAE